MQYFENQTTFALIDGAKLISWYTNSKTDLPKKEQHEIIKLAVDHLLLCKSNNPSTDDKIIWAQCLADLFPKLRDSTPEPTSDANYVSFLKFSFFTIHIFKYFSNLKSILEQLIVISFPKIFLENNFLFLTK